MRQHMSAGEEMRPNQREYVVVDAATRGFLRGTARDRGYERAAKFLILIGKEPAARVLAHLTAEEVSGLTIEMASTSAIERRESYRILEEFGVLAKTRDLYARGGSGPARAILVSAFGEGRGRVMFETIMRGSNPHPFSFLVDLEVDQVVSLLGPEPPAVIAVIVAHLAPKLAAEVIAELEPERQRDLVARIATLGSVPAETIQRTEEALRSKLRAQGKVVTQAVDGTSVLAEILANMGDLREEAILDGIAENDASLAEEVRRKMITEDLILRIEDLDLQRLLGELADHQLVLTLKAATAESRERLHSAISEGRRQLLAADEKALGPVLAAESTGALQALLEEIYQRARDGAISLPPSLSSA